MPKARPVLDRLMEKIEKQTDDGCWLWTGAICRSTGYGRFSMSRGVIVPAHRAVYLTLVGPIKPGLHLDHLCRTPPCVRPDHLEPVTPRENVRRAMTGIVGRNCCKAGHRYTKKNTWISSDGKRFCRACNRRRNRERQATRALSAATLTVLAVTILLSVRMLPT